MANFDLHTTDVPPGLSVIEASAGTGKTWTISHLVPRLLVDGVVSGIGDVLLVTFTEDAARELGEQTRRQLATLVGHANASTQPAEDQPGIRLLLDRLGALPNPAAGSGRNSRQATVPQAPICLRISPPRKQRAVATALVHGSRALDEQGSTSDAARRLSYACPGFAATAERPADQSDRCSRSPCIANGRLRQTGEGAVRRAPPRVVAANALRHLVELSEVMASLEGPRENEPVSFTLHCLPPEPSAPRLRNGERQTRSSGRS